MSGHALMIISVNNCKRRNDNIALSLLSSSYASQGVLLIITREYILHHLHFSNYFYTRHNYHISAHTQHRMFRSVSLRRGREDTGIRTDVLVIQWGSAQSCVFHLWKSQVRKSGPNISHVRTCYFRTFENFPHFWASAPRLQSAVGEERRFRPRCGSAQLFYQHIK